MHRESPSSPADPSHARVAHILADIVRSIGRLPCSRSVICAVISASVLIALSSSAIAAQDTTLVNGSHIRVQSVDDSTIREGTFRASTADSLRFSPGLDTSTETIALSRVSKIEVMRYRTGAGSVLKGAAIGTGVGLGATLALAGGCGLIKQNDCSLRFVLISPVIIGAGFLVGALIGADERGEHWSRVYSLERRASLLIGPMPHGEFALGLSVPFGSAPGH
jgi:hypothetical protein